MFLYLKCCQDTTFKILKCKWQKNLKQNCGCLQDMSLQSLEFSEPNSIYTKRSKKEKSNILNLVLKITGIMKTHLVSIYKFVSIFFATLNLNFLN
jgi:hypothetical protein